MIPNVDCSATSFGSGGLDGSEPVVKRARVEWTHAEADTPVVASVAPTEQEVAARHYDTLERTQETRHQSCIYHLRNINNFAKSCLITSAVQHCVAHPPSNLAGRPPLHVLDMCCGHGGDFYKWMKALDGPGSQRGGGRSFSGISYTGVDIAPRALEDYCDNRVIPYLKGASSARSPITVNLLVCADMTKDDLVSDQLPCIVVPQCNDRAEWSEIVPMDSCGLTPNIFDIISIQFSFHYMCQSTATLHHFFDQMAQLLRRPDKATSCASGRSGQVIITTVDSRAVFNLIAQEQQRREWSSTEEVDTSRSGAEFWAQLASSGGETGHTTGSAHLIVRHNNKILCRITYDQDDYHRLCHNHNAHGAGSGGGSDAMDISDDDLLGFKYYFQLFDTPPTDEEMQGGGASAAVNAPEWLVPVPVAGGNAHSVSVLAEIASQYDLKCSKYENFHEFISSQMQIPANADLFHSRFCYNSQGSVTDAEWKIIG